MRMLALLVMCACGRAGFEPLSDTTGDAPNAVDDADRPGDGALDSSSATIAWVKSFVARYPGSGATDTFTAAAGRAGNAVVMLVGCIDTNGAPTAVSVTAPGWTFVERNIVTNARLSATTLFAIAPNAQPATFVVSWTGANCNSGNTELADEFTNNDPNTMFDGDAFNTGIGNCTAAFTTLSDNSAVWAACFTASYVTATDTNYTRGADDTAGNVAEYKLTPVLAGTQQAATFTTMDTNRDYVMAAIGIKAR